jgi:hypothetical protein|tara:strand:+ start:676 stop:1011 length:336 start_codon:yes stop_codon:yes gene_type:complete
VKGRKKAVAFVSPSTVAQVAMYSDVAWKIRTFSEIRQDQCQMVDLRDDWVRLVGGTLPKATRMDMNVGNDAHPFVSAYFPKLAKPPTIDQDNTAVEGTGIDIVVENELPNG